MAMFYIRRNNGETWKVNSVDEIISMKEPLLFSVFGGKGHNGKAIRWFSENSYQIITLKDHQLMMIDTSRAFESVFTPNDYEMSLLLLIFHT